MVRDPLVLVYETIKQAVKDVHGKDFIVFDDFPNVNEYRKINRNAACITYVSGSVEKALMREFVPHNVKINNDNTCDVITETCRMDYVLQVSFFAGKKGMAQKLSTEFMYYLEQKNELKLKNDTLNEFMEIFLTEPPYPPRGDADLWQCDQTWRCRGKLLTKNTANKIDIRNFKPKIKNL